MNTFDKTMNTLQKCITPPNDQLLKETIMVCVKHQNPCCSRKQTQPKQCFIKRIGIFHKQTCGDCKIIISDSMDNQIYLKSQHYISQLKVYLLHLFVQ